MVEGAKMAMLAVGLTQLSSPSTAGSKQAQWARTEIRKAVDTQFSDTISLKQYRLLIKEMQLSTCAVCGNKFNRPEDLSDHTSEHSETTSETGASLRQKEGID